MKKRKAFQIDQKIGLLAGTIWQWDANEKLPKTVLKGDFVMIYLLCKLYVGEKLSNGMFICSN